MDGSLDGIHEAASSGRRGTLDAEGITYPGVQRANMRDVLSDHKAPEPYDFVWAEKVEAPCQR